MSTAGGEFDIALDDLGEGLDESARESLRDAFDAEMSAAREDAFMEGEAAHAQSLDPELEALRKLYEAVKEAYAESPTYEGTTQEQTARLISNAKRQVFEVTQALAEVARVT